MKESATGLVARYTNAGGSYYAPMLSLKVDGVGARYPLYDGVGSTRRLVDSSNNHTDIYDLTAFGEVRSSTVNTHNPYRGACPERRRRGGAWGYITDPSGMLQSLGRVAAGMAVGPGDLAIGGKVLSLGLKAGTAARGA